MNWFFSVLGALFGMAVATDRELLGAVFGFATVFGLMGQRRLRLELAQLRDELARLRQAAPAREPRTSTAQAGSAASPPTPTPTPTPTPAPPQPSAPGAPAFPTAMPTAPAQQAATPGAPTPQTPAASPAPAAATPPVRPRPAPAAPGWQDKLAAQVKAWFTEGNVPVKVGVLVLLFGVAAALKLAAERGYFSLSIEARLAVIAGAALAALAFGWRERERRPAFGLSLQGGALGVLLLTVFAAYRLYSLLPAGLAFALVVILVTGSAALALLQRNMALAVLGFLGGYLAPVLISTGSGNHVALFSYYAVLNAAVFAISWRQSWRLLNLIGFGFTFAVGTAWGQRFYRPELFATVEPFLILFFLFYIVIGLLYVIRQTEHRRPWVDGTLVFGTPLVAFPLQAGMLKDDRMGLALSALVVSLVYLALMAWLRRQRGERLLTEAYAALALGFATLAVPLAFSAGTTASLWALEGAGVAWLGIRQNRTLPWIAGLVLQLLAAGAYALSQFGGASVEGQFPSLLLNAQWFGAAIIAFSGLLLALIHDRHRPISLLPALLFAWGAAWWFGAGIGQVDLAADGVGEWPFAMLYFAATALVAAMLRKPLQWPRINWLIALSAIGYALWILPAQGTYGSPLAAPTLATWALAVLAMALALHRTDTDSERSLAIAHLATLWTLATAASLQGVDGVETQALGNGWELLAWAGPMALLSLALWRRQALAAWPRPRSFASYRAGWFAPAIALLSLLWLFGLFAEGSAAPLAYLPLLNPLELALIGLLALLFGLAGWMESLQPFRRLWPLAALALITLGALRAVHHGHGEPWSAAILDSGFTQATLTVVWSLVGVSAWIRGSRRRDRRVWMGGAALMAVVLLKLPFVDRAYMGNVPGIVSFIAVGLLLVVVGYMAPSPPATKEDEGSA